MTNLPVDYTKLTGKQRKLIREEYVDNQAGLCYHCNGKLTEDPIGKDKDRKVDWRLFPRGFFFNPVHLHHDHDTGMTIGAVHAKCNAVLWQYYGE